MTTQAEDFTIGVEEEYQIINPTTRELCSRVQQILPIAQEALGEKVQPEAQLKSCTWKHGCQNHNYVQGGQGVQY